MEIIERKLNGVLLLKPKLYKDNRGFFMETYSEKTFSDLGIKNKFVQDNHSMSLKKGTIRGLHFQLPPYTQAKLNRVIKGAVFDVAVDLRKNSPTFGKWVSFILSEKNSLILYIPRGFAHGFCTLEDNTEFIYKNDNFYAPSYEGCIRWNDPTLNIEWPIDPKEIIISEKDRLAPFFNDLELPF